MTARAVVYTDGQREPLITERAQAMLTGGTTESSALTALLAINNNVCRPPLPEDRVRAIVRAVAVRSGQAHTRDAPHPPATESYDVSDSSDTGLAAVFEQWQAGKLAYVGAWGWLARDRHVWRPDRMLRAYDCAKVLCNGASNGAASESQRRSIRSAKTVAAVVTLARSGVAIVADSAEFDKHRHELNTPNGVVDLRFGTMRSHLAADRFCHSTNVAPDFNARPDRWLKFLREVLKRGSDADTTAMVEYFRRLLGYCLTGEIREQAFAFFSGTGSNGKSTLLDLVLRIFGDYAIKLPAETLMISRGDRHPTEIAQLAGVRLAVSNEISEGAHWNEARMKEFTGDDVLRGRLMRQDFFSFPVTHKHLVSGNHRPVLRIVDKAFERRMQLVEFMHGFFGEQRNTRLPAELAHESGAVLAWMIGGAKDWYLNGLRVPEAVRTASAAYLDAMDDVGAWMLECCETATPPTVANASFGDPSSWLWRSYRDWMRGRGNEPMSNKRLTPLLESRGWIKGAVERGKVAAFRGLNLSTTERERVKNAFDADRERESPRPLPAPPRWSDT